VAAHRARKRAASTPSEPDTTDAIGTTEPTEATASERADDGVTVMIGAFG
jgi:hypothetical protein